MQQFCLKIHQLSLLDIPFLNLSRELVPQLPELIDGLVNDGELNKEASGLEEVINKIRRVLVH